MSDEETTDEPEGTPISVHDKDHPSLAATKEAQDVASLDRIIVPPGAYTDPNNPEAAGGSVNMSVYTHPSDIPDDYGESVEPGDVDVRSVLDSSLEEGGGAAAKGGADRSDDRDEWTKADWVAQAGDYGLSKSGNVDAVKDRVEEFEMEVEDAKDYNAGDWQSQIEDASSADELAGLRKLYDATDNDYVTVDQAFTDKEAEFSGSEA